MDEQRVDCVIVDDPLQAMELAERVEGMEVGPDMLLLRRAGSDFVRLAFGAQRLGFSSQKNPDKIEKDLLNLLPRKDWLDVNYLLVQHGRTVCIARKPRCTSCVLNSLCPSAVL